SYAYDTSKTEKWKYILVERRCKMSFAAFGFQSFINQALAESKFDQPTEVQEKLIPIIQDGSNIIGQSQTGSGKTHTFLLPLIDQIDPQLQKVQIVITTPSRELAEQIYQASKQIIKFAEQEIRVTNFVGGTDKKRQEARLQH